MHNGFQGQEARGQQQGSGSERFHQDQEAGEQLHQGSGHEGFHQDQEAEGQRQGTGRERFHQDQAGDQRQGSGRKGIFPGSGGKKTAT